jgi:outer membrane protein assembly factor BamB
MSRSQSTLPVSLLVLFALTSAAEAAGYSGLIKEFDAEKRTITIYIESRDLTKKLTIPTSASVTIDGKPGKLEDIQTGWQGSAFTTGGTTSVRRLSVRSEAPKPRPKPEPKPRPKEEPDPVRTEPAPKRTSASSTASWPQLRGPERNGQSSEQGLKWNWGAQGPAALWSQKGLGEGYSSVAVADGKVFTMGTDGGREVVLAMNLADGQPLWSTPVGSIFRNGQGNGPRGTPTIDGNRVYALGGNGDLVCLDSENGRSIWSKNVLREFGGRNIQWGISESVLIDGDKLICTPGGQRGTMVALNKQNGNVIWTCQVPGNPQASYSSAIAMEVGGVPQYVNMVHDRLIGVHAETGKLLWEDRNAVNSTANCSTPLAFNDAVFYATGYNTGGSLVSLSSSGDATTAKHKYHTDDMKNHHGGMVIVGDFLYGCSDPGFLICLDVDSGQEKWRSRNPGKGSIAYADGYLIVRNEKGPVTLVAANPERYEQIAQFETPQNLRSQRPQWAYPVVADGKLFLRDQDVLLVYDLSK